VQPTWVGADLDSWGIDHGTWSVLVHAFPDASIPVVQLSIHADKGLDYHLALGAKLASLRQRGVVVIGSGNVVHNLPGMNWSKPDDGYAYGSLSMTAYTLDLPSVAPSADQPAAPETPAAPPDASNI
jgi:4,5-DOPA dioxygenase extradiol